MGMIQKHEYMPVCSSVPQLDFEETLHQTVEQSSVEQSSVEQSSVEQSSVDKNIKKFRNFFSSKVSSIIEGVTHFKEDVASYIDNVNKSTIAGVTCALLVGGCTVLTNGKLGLPDSHVAVSQSLEEVENPDVLNVYHFGTRPIHVSYNSNIPTAAMIQKRFVGNDISSLSPIKIELNPHIIDRNIREFGFKSSELFLNALIVNELGSLMLLLDADGQEDYIELMTNRAVLEAAGDFAVFSNFHEADPDMTFNMLSASERFEHCRSDVKPGEKCGESDGRYNLISDFFLTNKVTRSNFQDQMKKFPDYVFDRTGIDISDDEGLIDIVMQGRGEHITPMHQLAFL